MTVKDLNLIVLLKENLVFSSRTKKCNKIDQNLILMAESMIRTFEFQE